MNTTLLEQTIKGQFQVTGISHNGPYVKVRSSTVGGTYKVANVPFTATDKEFYAVKDAFALANLIADIPVMLILLHRIHKENATEFQQQIVDLFFKHAITL